MNSNDYYERCTALVEQLTESYDGMLDSCENYLDLLAEWQSAEAAAAGESHATLAELLRRHVALTQELHEVLGTLTLDALIRCTDRVVLMKIAAQDRFV